MIHIASFTLALLTSFSCVPSGSSSEGEGDGAANRATSSGTTKAAKLLAQDCKDPDLSKLSKGETLMLCDGTIGEGTYEAAAGELPDPWDLRYGVTVGSTTGKLKLNCRNMVGSYDNTTSPASAGTDVFDTVDDYNNDGDFPSTNPWDSDGHFCGYNDPSDPTWEWVTTTPATSGANSVFKDKISGLNWTRGNVTSTRTWNASLTYCDDLDHGGVDSWRLPTQKELMEAYSHGIHDLDSVHTPADHLGDLDAWFWSSSPLSYAASYAWSVYLNNGDTNYYGKTNSSGSVLCVSP